MAHIAVVGAGSWGTALAVMAHRYGHTVSLWSPFEAEVQAIRQRGEHEKLLPGVAVSSDIHLTTDLSCTVGADAVVLAVPSFAIDETAQKLAAVLPQQALVVNVGKGLDATTYRRFSEILCDRLPNRRIAVLSGPSHAEEVARDIPTSVVASATETAVAEEVQDLLMNRRFRIYVNTDLVGVELGGALKNVMALAAGMADGMQMGDNARAALMTRGLTEMARLGLAMGARAATFAGLTGMGDLVVTCSSRHSRNYRAGFRIGQGASPADAVAEVGTVEGYFASKAAYELARRRGVEMPIAEQCYRICYEQAQPLAALELLMQRPRNHEVDQNWLG